MLKKLVSLLIIISAATAHDQQFQYTEIQLKGSCPKIKYINNFNLPRIVGWYYQAFSSLDNPLCFENEGQTLYAAQYDERTISLQLCCRSSANRDEAICGKKIGSGPAIATNINPLEFAYEINNESYLAYVIDTDYENFTVAYGCKPGSKRSTKRDELIFVLSRDYELTDALEKRVRNLFKRNGIEWCSVKPVKQGTSIPYTPIPRPCDRDRGCGCGRGQR